MSDPGPAQDFLSKLAGDEVIPAERIAAVVAHADDETIGLGAQLPRLAGITIVHVTDSAPRDLVDARNKGFATAEDYAAARRHELAAAMALAGIPATALVQLGIPDQGASLNLAPLARQLAALFAEQNTEMVLTHAYEGGHPDHDAAAFAVHAAGKLLARRNPDRQLLIVEIPLYRAGQSGWERQSFVPAPDRPELAVWLNEDERALKGRMVKAHVSQRDLLASFPIAVERFRVAPDYDFASLPNGGDLLYERQNWGMTGAHWLDLTRQALTELGEVTA